MAREHPPDWGTSDDIEDVISTLDGIAARAAAGTVVAVTVILRDASGEDFCVSAGAYRRAPRSALYPALLGLVQLCSSDDGAPVFMDSDAAAPHVLH